MVQTEDFTVFSEEILVKCHFFKSVTYKLILSFLTLEDFVL